MKKNLYILVFIFSLFSCSQNSNTNKGTIYNDNFITIAIDEVSKESFIDASSFFKNVKSIILETNENVLIGEIGNVYVNDSYIIIYDSSPKKAIFVFDSEGKFIRNIGKLGAGPGEYTNISDFTVDKNNKEIYIIDPTSRKINKYDLITGQFINSIHPKPWRFSDHIQYTSSSLFIDSNYKTNEQDLLYEIDKKKGKEIYSWLDANTYNSGWIRPLTFGTSFFFSRNTDEPKYVNLFMDTVMTIVNNNLTPFLAIKSERWVTIQELQKAQQELGIDAHTVISKNNRVFGITKLMEWRNRMFFNLWDGEEEYTVYHSKEGTKIFKLLLDNLVYKVRRFPINNMQCTDSKGMYACSYPQEFAFFAGMDLKDILNPDIDKYNELIQLPEDANPVIFYYELKD